MPRAFQAKRRILVPIYQRAPKLFDIFQHLLTAQRLVRAGKPPPETDAGVTLKIAGFLN